MRILALLLITLSLSACSTWNSWMGSDTVTEDEPMACLPVFVPDELAAISQGGSDSPMDVKADIRISAGQVECDKEDGKLRQSVVVKLTASKGPALKNGETSTAFFAALAEPNGDVIAKKQYQTRFEFGDELKVEEEQTLVFNINQSDATRTNIYIGLSNAVASIR